MPIRTSRFDSVVKLRGPRSRSCSSPAASGSIHSSAGPTVSTCFSLCSFRTFFQMRFHVWHAPDARPPSRSDSDEKILGSRSAESSTLLTHHCGSG